MALIVLFLYLNREVVLLFEFTDTEVFFSFVF